MEWKKHTALNGQEYYKDERGKRYYIYTDTLWGPYLKTDEGTIYVRKRIINVYLEFPNGSKKIIEKDFYGNYYFEDKGERIYLEDFKETFLDDDDDDNDDDDNFFSSWEKNVFSWF